MTAQERHEDRAIEGELEVVDAETFRLGRLAREGGHPRLESVRGEQIDVVRPLHDGAFVAQLANGNALILDAAAIRRFADALATEECGRGLEALIPEPTPAVTTEGEAMMLCSGDEEASVSLETEVG